MLDPAAAAAWEDDGWCAIPDAIPPADLASARAAVARLFPSAEEMAAGLDDSPWHTWDATWPEFPFESGSLNRLVVHDVVLDLAATLLGTDDLRLYAAIATAKYVGQSSGYNQLLHADYPNHTLVVPRTDGGYQHLETLIYLTEVTAESGATRMVSTRRTAGIPVEEHTLNLDDYGDLYADPGVATGPAGTIVAYRPDVYHRSVDLTVPGAHRLMLHVAYRPAKLEWVGYQAWPFKGFAPAWHRFMAKATPRQLAVLGFPRPGDPYWTAGTLAGVAARYPNLDMRPWLRSGER